MTGITLKRTYRQLPARLRGFTLVELMITVAIVAILAAIALPAYQKQIRQSRESSAKSALLDLARREEIFYSTTNTYTLQMATLGYSSANISNNAITVPSATQAYYTITVTAGTTPAGSGTTATTYIASATPVAGSTQANDPCGTFTLNYLGVQTPSASSGGGLNCW